MSRRICVVGVRKLGRVIALHFAKQGWEVVCAGRSLATLEAVAKEVTAAGGTAQCVVCDLTQPESLRPLAALLPDLAVVAQTTGGRFGPMPFLQIEASELVQGFTSMVVGSWHFMQVVGGAMVAAKRGTLLQVGTSSGVRTKEGYANNAATHGGLRMLVQTVAREFRASGVHVAYLPVDGGIRSERYQAEAAIAPEAIAGACEFLFHQDPTAWTHELVLRHPSSAWTAPT